MGFWEWRIAERQCVTGLLILELLCQGVAPAWHRLSRSPGNESCSKYSSRLAHGHETTSVISVFNINFIKMGGGVGGGVEDGMTVSVELDSPPGAAPPRAGQQSSGKF